MKESIKRIPTPIVGLILALAATGNLVESYGSKYRNIFGLVSATILVLYLVKLIRYPKKVREELDNPVVASVFPTLSMALILLSTYIRPFLPILAFSIWIIGLILHVILILNFTIRYTLEINLKQVFPSWFIPYVGIVIGAVTAPAFQMVGLGKFLFWFGIISYLILLPIILKRLIKEKDIPKPAQPTIAIFAAPLALCLAGYINSFTDKNMVITWGLVILSQFTYLMVILQLPKLLKLSFLPSYSAFTFPLVISAISIKLTNGFLVNNGQSVRILQYMVGVEEIIAVLIVLYVLLRYILFILKEPISSK